MGFVGGSKRDAAAGAREEIEVLIGVFGKTGKAATSAVLLGRRYPGTAYNGGRVVVSEAAVHVVVIDRIRECGIRALPVFWIER